MGERREEELIGWLRQAAADAGGRYIGDDAALIEAFGATAITVDSQIAGTHFPPDLDPRIIARRLLAVNLSDLAAVGAEPRFAFLALAAPPGFDHRAFFSALVRSCRRWQVELAGGDLAKAPQVTASLTLLGSCPPNGRWLERRAGREGDVLWLGGPIGLSALGRELLRRGARAAVERVTLPPTLPGELAAVARRAVRRHLSPAPQIDLGLWLGRAGAGAVIDLSDGLGKDLHRLCEASGVGARVDRRALAAGPKQDALRRWCGLDPLAPELGGGEDYVLLFSLPTDAPAPPFSACRTIGRLTRERSVVLESITPDGVHRQPLPAAGWDHFEP